MRRLPFLRAAAGLLALGLLAGAPPAGAIFIETPLRLAAEPGEADVGHKVRLTIDAANGTSETRWKDQTIRVAWEVVDPENGPGNGSVADNLRLDGRAHAAFDWTLPEATRDRNIFVVLFGGDERLGQAHLRVGDAEPMAFTLGGPGGGAVDEGKGNEGNEDTGATNGSGDQDRSASNATPGLGVVVAVAGLGAVAALARKRRA